MPDVWAWTMPGLYLAVALYIDHLEPGGTITPFFVVIGLMFMALKFQPMQMIPWAVVYAAVLSGIFYPLKSIHFFRTYHSMPNPHPAMQGRRRIGSCVPGLFISALF